MEQGRRSGRSDGTGIAANPWTAPILIAALVLLPLPTARADAPGSSHGFASFCERWMEKLRAREIDNARDARIVQRESRYVGEFKGYGRKPLRCHARPTGSPSTPWVGQIVYEEIIYRVTGPDPKAARQSDPKPASRSQVMEIFRFDGTRWVW